MKQRRFYHGDGQQRAHVTRELPVIDSQQLRAPKGYLANPDLAAAVDVALTLGMPLLLTGEPGSGKSGLAYSLAHELGLGDPLRYVIKSDTQARDLFYHFDTVGRFHASNVAGASKEDADPRQFITFEALGRAILYAKPPSYAYQDLALPEAALVKQHKEPKRSVVLIDEIDKAPRDVPNDILVELENLQFQIPELSSGKNRGISVRLDGNNGSADNQYRPIVVITSNSEKSLPEAFLRRCIYHNLKLPPFRDSKEGSEQVTIEDIVGSRLGDRFASRGKTLVDDGLSIFRLLRHRDSRLSRGPSLAELLNWLDYLLNNQAAGLLGDSLAELDRAVLLDTIGQMLVKDPDDQHRLPDVLSAWPTTRSD